MTKSQLFLSLAAIAGGVVAMVAHPTPRTPLQRFIFLICGLLSATFIAPYVTHRYHLEDPSELALVYFSVGALWNSIFDKALQVLNAINFPTFGSK